MSRKDLDRGLQAVSRVRAVRERDSRLGLQQAIAEQGRQAERVAELERSLREHGSQAVTDVAQFVALRASLSVLTRAVSQAQGELDQSAVVRSSADAHWRSHKTRLSAVDNLLEARVDERRASDAHDAAKELDEVAGQLWLRRTAGGHA